MTATARMIGTGRAAGALAGALNRSGWTVEAPIGRGAPVTGAADGVDVVVIATPDTVIAEVAAAIEPRPDTVVMHLAGSLGLDVLGPHARPAAVHPLMALPDADTGAQRLLAGGWFAVAGDELARRMVADLGGRSFEVADEHRVLYHAAAVVASNHLVGLLGQVERLARTAGVPFEAYLDLVRGTVDNVAELGPARALTGPVARRDQVTIDRHRATLDPSEHELYDVLVAACRRLLR